MMTNGTMLAGTAKIRQFKVSALTNSSYNNECVKQIYAGAQLARGWPTPFS
jgi:hypothetical protein